MGRRRYPVPEHPTYSRAYDIMKGDSPILNPRAFSEVSLQAGSKEGIESLIREWTGEAKGEHQGQFWNPLWGGAWCDSRLKQAKEALAAIDDEWSNIRIRAQRSGRPVPEEMPAELVEKQLRLEAGLDIAQEELDALKKELGRWEAREKKATNDNLLKYGPRGSCKGADPVREIDGQKVIQRDGEFFIDCPASPYHDMKLPDYFALVVHPFNLSRIQPPLTKEERELGPKIPFGRFGDGTIDPADLPPRPEEV